MVANISEHFPPQPSLKQLRSEQQELHALLLAISVRGLKRPLLTITSKMQETGPTVYSPHLRRPERLTIRRLQRQHVLLLKLF